MEINCSGKIRDYGRLDILCPICGGWYSDGPKHRYRCSAKIDEILATEVEKQTRILEEA